MYEFPKWLYGPDGVSLIVDNAEQEAAQLAAWAPVADADEDDTNTDAPRKRGRPPKAR